MNMYDENNQSGGGLYTDGARQQFGMKFAFFGFLLWYPQPKPEMIGLMFYSSPKNLNRY